MSMAEGLPVTSDLEEWPTLGDAVGREENDWELLAPEDEDEPSSREESHVVVVAPPSSSSTSKILHHCASSPDLRRYSLADVDEEEDDLDDNRDESYSMVSGPTSVISLSSGLTFRDAILATKEEKQAPQDRPVEKPAKQRIRPRIVVKPIRRGSKSTGDLQSLVIHEDEDVMGDTDAMDFYHRKALGAKGRVNGSKMRPDEAKRKAITMHKKDLQRQANASRGS